MVGGSGSQWCRREAVWCADFSGREIGSADGDLRVGVAGLWTGRLPQWFIGQTQIQIEQQSNEAHAVATLHAFTIDLSMRSHVLIHLQVDTREGRDVVRHANGTLE